MDDEANAISTGAAALALTDRQRREIAYHEDLAARHEQSSRVCYDIVESPRRKWWNAEWFMYSRLLQEGLSGRRALVVGCGFGDDAFYLARAGAEVTAFDLSPDLLAIARDTARREGLTIRFDRMPAERIDYANEVFDYVLARDILHHVDIPTTLGEIGRVLKPGGCFAMDEVYLHSALRRIRTSHLIDKVLYPRLVRHVYQTDTPYITDDERQMDENDVALVAERLQSVTIDYFNCINARFYPPTSVPLMKVDRRLMSISRIMSAVIGGRVVLIGRRPH